MTDCDLLIDTALKAWGRIDVLCNNVGVRQLAPICEMELERGIGIAGQSSIRVYLF